MKGKNRELVDISKEVKHVLDSMKEPNDSYDKVLRRKLGLEPGRSRGSKRK